MPALIIVSLGLAYALGSSPGRPPALVVAVFLAMALAGLVSVVCAVLLARHLTRPGFLTGWSAAGNLCASLFIVLAFAQPQLVRLVLEREWSTRWFGAIAFSAWCLLIAAVVLQWRGYARHRKMHHVG